MLTIYYGDLDDVIYNTSVFFNNTYSAEWLEDPFAQQIIKSVDRGIVLGSNAIQTKILGIIPPEKLSSGTKTLLLMNFMPNRIYNASNCGDNCARWILEIGKRHDITINLYHLMNFGRRAFTVKVANTGEIVHSIDDLNVIAVKCLKGEAQ